MTTEHRLVSQSDDIRIDKYIADADIGLSRSGAVNLILSGNVLLNGFSVG